MKIAKFTTAIAELLETKNAEFKHPLLTMIKFVFADDRGALLSSSNGLPQGIKAEDFDEVIKTAIHMPIKMNFLGAKRGVQGHVGSLPIGHITQMEKDTAEDGTNRLIASAVLYGEEFPDEIQFIRTAFAEGKSPGISYEIVYNDPLIENGVEWLKNMITRAATFVRSPAYGKRTALLALASNSDLSDEDFATELLAIIKPKEEPKHMDEDKEKIAKLEADATARTSELDALKAQVTDFTGQLATLTDENSNLKKTALMESRVRAFTEAGFTLEADAEKASKKKDVFASMSDEVFAEYIADLKAASAKAPGFASASARNGVPRLALAGADKDITIDTLKESLRFNRGAPVTTE